MPKLPKQPEKCVARVTSRKPPQDQCRLKPTPEGAGYFCTVHAAKFLTDSYWPLIPSFQKYRTDLRQKLIAVRRFKPDPTDSPPAGLYRYIFDFKVLGPALLLLVAFFSEYVFFMPLGIDFSFFVTSIESIPILVKNIAFVGAVGVGVFVLIYILILIVISAISLGRRARQHNRIKKSRLAIYLSYLQREVAKNEHERHLKERDRLEINNRLIANENAVSLLEKNPQKAYVWTHGLRSSILSFSNSVLSFAGIHLPYGLFVDFEPILSKESGEFSSEGKFRSWCQQNQEHLINNGNRISEEADRARCEINDLEKDAEKLSKRAVVKQKILNSFFNRNKYLYRILFRSFLKKELFNGLPPRFMTRPWVIACLFISMLILPLVYRYYEGNAVASCAKTIINPLANAAENVCPPNSNSNWLATIKLDSEEFDDTKKLSLILASGSAERVSYKDFQGYLAKLQDTLDNLEQFEELFYETYPEEASKFEASVTKIDPVELWPFQMLKGYLGPMEHKFPPVVTVTFENDAPPLRKANSRLGLSNACAPVGNGRDVGFASGVDYNQIVRRVAEKLESNENQKSSTAPATKASSSVSEHPLDRPCHLIRNGTSARMAYLGEAGPWTLLYTLGMDGGPLLIDTRDIAAISFAPVMGSARPGAGRANGAFPIWLNPALLSVAVKFSSTGESTGIVNELKQIHEALVQGDEVTDDGTKPSVSKRLLDIGSKIDGSLDEKLERIVGQLNQVRGGLIGPSPDTELPIANGSELKNSASLVGNTLSAGAEFEAKVDEIKSGYNGSGDTPSSLGPHVLASLNNSEEWLREILSAIGENSGKLNLPDRFVGVDAQDDLQHCMEDRRDVEVAFQFDWNERRIEPNDADLVAGLDISISRLSEMLGDIKQGELLVVLIEGTADSTGAPRINIDFSEARATFIHREFLKRARKEFPGPVPDVLDERIAIASYGTGEWSHLPVQWASQENDSDLRPTPKPRSVLIRFCTIK